MVETVSYQRNGQAGFSMLEMLMSAFILAIGILGLATLQIMVLRTNAGSRASTTAIKVGESIAEMIQTQGRQCLLYARNGQTPPTSIYFSANTPIKLFFNFAGQQENISTADVNTFFTVTITRTDLDTPVISVGGMKAFQINVVFNDTIDPTDSKKMIQRTVRLTRQVAYANA